MREVEWAAFANELADWRAELTGRGLLRPDSALPDLVVALHRLGGPLAMSADLHRAADTVGDVRTQNQPGTDEEYPNWQVPLSDGKGNPITLEDLADSELLPVGIGGGWIMSAVGSPTDSMRGRAASLR